jgi:hypothetical protein
MPTCKSNLMFSDDFLYSEGVTHLHSRRTPTLGKPNPAQSAQGQACELGDDSTRDHVTIRCHVSAGQGLQQLWHSMGCRAGQSTARTLQEPSPWMALFFRTAGGTSGWVSQTRFSDVPRWQGASHSQASSRDTQHLVYKITPLPKQFQGPSENMTPIFPPVLLRALSEMFSLTLREVAGTILSFVPAHWTRSFCQKRCRVVLHCLDAQFSSTGHGEEGWHRR